MPKPANLIFFTGENHCQRVLGAYGHPVVRTPHLDRLAARGTLFRNAYCSSPLCCPARASLATGRYPHETGYWENSTAYDGRVPSWMHRLRDAGHEVVAIGKLHYRATEDDNGFTEEIVPMHILDGIGGLFGLLRGSGEEPVRDGNWQMYVTDCGAGSTDYQAYDRDITRRAVTWLREHAAKSGRPWVLCVNHVSAHPPFRIPRELLDLYPPASIPPPVAWRKDERPRHPAIEHLRRILGSHDDLDEHTMRRVAAAYFALVTHLDEQVGQVLAAAEALDLLDHTRIVYTADHGDSFGNHYIFGKFHLYERAAAVPLIMAGPQIPAGHDITQLVSHVDLFPTIVEGMGLAPHPAEANLAGASLWPALAGRQTARIGFAEYHGLGSKNASYLIRDGDMKLIFHVAMPAQLFDLKHDPDEVEDLAADPAHAAARAALEAKLRAIVDPEAVDARAKADQRAKAAQFGGTAAILARGGIPYTPAPGAEVRFVPVTSAHTATRG